MRVFVVACRPVADSLTTAVLDRVLAVLRGGGHDVRLGDLYADGFRPAVSAAEHHAGRGPTDHGPTDHDSVDDDSVDLTAAADLAVYAGHLRWCEAIVLVYPTWWSGQPAMLTGWFDRVLVDGCAWDLTEGRSRTWGMLRNVRRLVVVTTHGSSKLVNAAQGEGGKRVVGRAVRAACHPLARTTWIAMYGVDRSSPEDRQRFLARVEHRLARL